MLLNDQAARVDFRYLYRVFLHVHVHVKFLYELGRYIFLFFKGGWMVNRLTIGSTEIF